MTDEIKTELKRIIKNLDNKIEELKRGRSPQLIPEKHIAFLDGRKQAFEITLLALEKKEEFNYLAHFEV